MRESTWLGSVREALRYAPDELYLYPLYVRPGTGLGGTRRTWDDLRLACYRAGVELLCAGRCVLQDALRHLRCSSRGRKMACLN